MNQTFQAVISTTFRPKRTCPKCKRDQADPAGKRLENVRCKFCGAGIPPRK